MRREAASWRSQRVNPLARVRREAASWRSQQVISHHSPGNITQLLIAPPIALVYGILQIHAIEVL
jgi:hypothetical protein